MSKKIAQNMVELTMSQLTDTLCYGKNRQGVNIVLYAYWSPFSFLFKKKLKCRLIRSEESIDNLHLH